MMSNYKGFLELRKLSAEKVLKFASSKLFIDIRKVRRFRIWQAEYLDHVMHGIAINDSEKQKSLTKKYLQSLSYLVKKSLQKSFYKWSFDVRQQKLFKFPEAKFSTSIKLIGVLLKWEFKALGSRNFPISTMKSSKWRASRLKVALFKWREKVISALLGESHREMATIKINHFLHKKTTPLTSFALRKICTRLGAKLGCVKLFITLKKITQSFKQTALMSFQQKKINLVNNIRGKREKTTKILMLQKFVGFLKLSSFLNKNFKIETEKLMPAMMFFYWKKNTKRVKKHRNNKISGPNRKLKQFSAKFIVGKSNILVKQFLSRFFRKWQIKKTVTANEFPIDKLLYKSQAKIAVCIESKVLQKASEIKKRRKNIALQNLDLILRKKFRTIFNMWVYFTQRERNKFQNEDVVFEYISYLEEHLGVPHKFRQ